MRYSGSPIPMSFAERNNNQGVVLVDLENENVNISLLTFEAPVKMLSIPAEAKTLPEVLNVIGCLLPGEITDRSPFLEIKVLITEPEPSLRYQIEEALRGKSVRLARIVAVTPEREQQAYKILTYEELQNLQPLDIAMDVFRQKYGGEEMPDAMRGLLQEVIKEVGL